jgi:hypothetical protein
MEGFGLQGLKPWQPSCARGAKVGIALRGIALAATFVSSSGEDGDEAAGGRSQWADASKRVAFRRPQERPCLGRLAVPSEGIAEPARKNPEKIDR